jgi:AcrR family transcriptional regulator
MNVPARDLRRQEELDATRAVRRRRAVEAATALFAQCGFHATAMADVAREAGLSLKALYDSFPSKEALFEAVLADVGDRFSELLEPPEPAADPVQWLLSFIDRMVVLLEANTSALRLYSRGADGIPTVLRDNGVNPFAGFTAHVTNLLTKVICDAQRTGAAAGFEPAVLARGLFNLVVAETRHRLEADDPMHGAVADLSPIVTVLLRPLATPT